MQVLEHAGLARSNLGSCALNRLQFSTAGQPMQAGCFKAWFLGSAAPGYDSQHVSMARCCTAGNSRQQLLRGDGGACSAEAAHQLRPPLHQVTGRLLRPTSALGSLHSLDGLERGTK